METLTDNHFGDNPGGYTREGLYEIEDTLTWSEENFRSPKINCLEGWGIPTEPPDSPKQSPLDACLYHNESDPFRWLCEVYYRGQGLSPDPILTLFIRGAPAMSTFGIPSGMQI